jgi:hypothetical protein
MTQERIRRLKAKALMKLKRPPRSRKLDSLLDSCGGSRLLLLVQKLKAIGSWYDRTVVRLVAIEGEAELLEG